MKDPIDYVDPEWQEKHERLRVERGFSNFDAWNGDEYLAWIIAGMVRWHRKNNHGYPASLTPKKWKKILKKIERGMKAHLELNSSDSPIPPGEDYRTWMAKQEKLCERGWKLLAKWHGSLWD